MVSNFGSNVKRSMNRYGLKTGIIVTCSFSHNTLSISRNSYQPLRNHHIGEMDLGQLQINKKIPGTAQIVERNPDPA
jgi:hypothetical protein